MRSLDNNTQAFLALVRAGLWETDVRLSYYDGVVYEKVMRLAEEQSVVGLVTAGLEHVQDVKVPKEVILQFIGQSLQIEQRNREMNGFISSTVAKMRNEGIYGLLVKGSGLAQCYSRPLWRTCGDVDFFFSDSEYKKAIDFFITKRGYSGSESQIYKELRSCNRALVYRIAWDIKKWPVLQNGQSD